MRNLSYLARTLNIELKPDGIKNILIRCGGIDTASPKRTENNIVGQICGFPDSIIDIYKKRLEKTEKELKKFAKKRTHPNEVAMLIVKILIAKRPKARY